MHSTFAFAKIVIIQSLEECEHPTGERLRDALAALNGELGQSVPVELRTCESAVGFRAIVDELTEAASVGQIPLLHVECHGDEQAGLIFENASELPWQDLAAMLSRLNDACQYNLFAVFAACFGAHFLGQINAFTTSPCFAIVAPTEFVFPDEIEAAFRQFYRDLFNGWDAALAVKKLRSRRLTQGHWFAETAERWFERVVMAYVETKCTRKEMKPRVRALYRRLLAEGNRQSIGRLKRWIKNRNQRAFLDEYFDRFFGTKKFPDNRQRFSGVHERMKRRLSDIWCKREYRP
ncbi:hypothetical protein [Caballeronia sp. LjRoot31]|uniref:hypothetical protein n=1 Tax=Caballeronia sp. LjRoot31 TaxID=3342324 RepID=UPI003ECF49CF